MIGIEKFDLNRADTWVRPYEMRAGVRCALYNENNVHD